MTTKAHARFALFLDFDGTVTDRDVVDALLEHYADPRWLEIERDWQAGHIGSRECLEEQVALLRATPRDLDSLLTSIDIDPGFPALLDLCTRWRIPMHIVSDGFDYCIERILQSRLSPLARRQLLGVCVCASHLEPRGETEWTTRFPFYGRVCVHGCATCKPAAMRRLRGNADVSVFVGDGLSDRHAVEAAGVIFAKERLASYCRETGIPYRDYRDLSVVAEFLDEAMHGPLSVRVPEQSVRA